MKTVPELNDKVTIHNIIPDYTDRSYQNEVWEVASVNKTHAQLKCTKTRGILSDTIIVLISEYEFSEAETFLV